MFRLPKRGKEKPDRKPRVVLIWQRFVAKLLITHDVAGRWTTCRLGETTRRVAGFAVVTFGAIAISASANARTAQEAQALVERAVAYIQDVGREQAFADFSRRDGGFVDGDLYIFCQDISGVVIAHGGNPKLVGQNLSDVRGPDGRFANVEINHLGLSQGSGWLEFRWPNPVTKRIELKDAYVLKVDDHTVCGSGYYKGVPP
jgi:signal transduction histidine kinase